MITGFYAAILAFMYIGLSMYIISARRRLRVSMGSGGNPELERRMRVHGNFAEYIPFILLLMFMLETINTNEYLIHAFGGFAILGRVLHAMGLKPDRASIFRVWGMVLTFLNIAIMSTLLIIAFFVFDVPVLQASISTRC